MNAFVRLSNLASRFSRARYIVPFLILVAGILTLMEIGPIGIQRFRSLGDGDGMLDMRFGYSANQVATLFENLGEEGRRLYSGLLGLDFAFALTYTALQALLVSALLRKAGLGGPWTRCNLIPFARSALDLVENFLLLFLLARFPKILSPVVTLSSAITVVKLTLNYGYIAFVLFLGAKTAISPSLTEVRS